MICEIDVGYSEEKITFFGSQIKKREWLMCKLRLTCRRILRISKLYEIEIQKRDPVQIECKSELCILLKNKQVDMNAALLV